jgi:hypothetical protein
MERWGESGVLVSSYLYYKVHINLQTVSVPSLELGPSQPPCTTSPPSECTLPPGTKGGGGLHTRLRVRGWASPNSDDWKESLVLCLLCDN